VSVAENGQFTDGQFVIEDMWLRVFSARMMASGFGQVGDGRGFAFAIRGQWLLVEVYRPRLRGPVPQREDVVATVRRRVFDVNITDERSLAAAVRDAVAVAQASG